MVNLLGSLDNVILTVVICGLFVVYTSNRGSTLIMDQDRVNKIRITSHLPRTPHPSLRDSETVAEKITKHNKISLFFSLSS